MPRVLSHVALLLVQVAALVWITRFTPLAAGFPLDDAWIHQLVARNFATTGVLGALPDRPLSGATSLLYPCLLALNFRFFELPPSLFTSLLNGGLYVLAGHLFLLGLLRDGQNHFDATLAATLGAISGNWVWFAVSGMEVSLLVTLLLLSALQWAAPSASTRSATFAGAWLALAFGVRPEAAALLLALLCSARLCRRSLRQLVCAAAPLLLAVLSYAVLTAGGGPSTTRGRRWMWLESLQGVSAEARVLHFATCWADRLAHYVLGLQELELFWLVAGFAVVGVVLTLDERRRTLCVLCCLQLCHFLTFAILMPTEGHGGRYQPLGTLLFIPLAWLGAVGISRLLLARYARAHRRVWSMVPLAWSLALGLPVGLVLDQWGIDHALAVKHIEVAEAGMARELAKLPAAARIASFDVGAMGFFSGRQLLDLGGLLDPSVLPEIIAGRTDRLLEARHIDYVVIPMGYSVDFPDPWNFRYRLNIGSSKRFELVQRAVTFSPQAQWTPGLKATLHGAPVQRLFEIKW